jgi:isoquinoline 1-oxidoreductase subunit beta
MTFQINRRGFLASTGGLAVTFSVPALAATEATALTAYLHVRPDGRVKLWSPTTEMGQGTHTGQAAIIADELGVALNRISVETAQPAAPFRRPLGNPNAQMGSGGSWGIRSWVTPLRTAAAQARELLIAEAADRLKVPASELVARDGQVTHTASKRSLGFGALAAGAAKRTPPEKPALRPATERRYHGKSFRRVDIPDKVRGRKVFASDASVPGMVYACAALSPDFRATGSLAGADAKARGVKGVQQVVPIPGGYAVVAANSWAAMQGAKAIEAALIEAAPPENALSSAQISAAMREALQAPSAISARNDGDATAAMASAARTVTAVYEAPYLAHAPMEPFTCTVALTDGKLEAWTGTQTQDRTRNGLARAAGLQPEQVIVHTLMTGGGFGRRLRDEEGYAQAVAVAKAVGKPVKFFWTREDELAQGWYRPAQVARLMAGLDAKGTITALDIRTAGPSMQRDFAPAGTQFKDGQLDATSVQSILDSRYKPTSAFKVEWVMNRHAPPTAPWRAVGSTQNGYFLECFLDEIAAATGQDPVDLRRTLLAHDARALKVINEAAAKADWGKPLPKGHARGFAYVESYGSLCAQVVEASLVEGKPKVHRVTAVIDCGDVVSRDGALSQMEGGIVMGLSTALGEQITVEKGRAVERNFDSYQLLRMPDSPTRIDVHFIESGQTIGGIGEPGVPPTAPALVNAIVRLTGKPIRKLPILPELERMRIAGELQPNA